MSIKEPVKKVKKIKVKPKKKLNLDDDVLLKALIKSVELLNICLVETRAKLNLENGFEYLSTNNDKEINVLLESTEYTASYANDVKILFCGVRFATSVSVENFELPVAEVFAEYGLFYKVNGEIDYPKSVFEGFAGSNAIFNAWPFYREHVFSLAGKMGIQAIVVPLLRLPLNHPK